MSTNSTMSASSSSVSSTSISSSSSSSVPPTTSSSSSSIQSTTSSSSSSTTVSTSSSAPRTTSSPPVDTSTSTAPAPPPTTSYSTSIVTETPGGTATHTGATIVTVTPSPSSDGSGSQTSSKPTSSSSGASPIDNGKGGDSSSGGLSTGGKTAIAVVIPVVVVALLVLAGLFLWRRRKRNNEAQEARRKEIQDYGFNPNNDPTIPAVASEAGGPAMAEDHSSGYRGWGTATVASTRKASTTLSGGHTHGQLSDSGSNNMYTLPPVGGAVDGHSGDQLVNNSRNGTMASDDLGMLGAGPLAANNQPIRRGPSNASSAYSAGGRSDHSEDAPPLPQNGGYAYDGGYNANYGYSQHGPYGDGSYGGAPDAGMPVVRDVSARRNTRIQQGGQYQQGNSGIAQNF